jgi:hypothetical protein
LDDEGISVEAYNQIAQGLQMGQDIDDMDINSDDGDNFENAVSD